jgi:hypothetical protein
MPDVSLYRYLIVGVWKVPPPCYVCKCRILNVKGMISCSTDSYRVISKFVEAAKSLDSNIISFSVFVQVLSIMAKALYFTPHAQSFVW